MAALALISTDSGLYDELNKALEGSEWSVEWLESSVIHDAGIKQDVVALDAGHPSVDGWQAPQGKPVLLILGVGGGAPGSHELANDIVFRGVSATELLVRLERLRTRTPLKNLRRRYVETFASMAPRLKTMEFLESLIDASVDAIIATDMDQRVVLFNPSAERITGRHVSDALGVLTLEDLLGRGSSELVMGRLLTEEHGGDGRLEPTMLELVDVHGAHIPVQLSASVIYEHDQPSAIVLIFADLRERIRVEERLADAQKKLAFTEKQGVLAELAGTAAHELNQPLTSMMAYAELLLRQSEPGSTGAKAAQVLIREAERMAEIVRKIGKITRYETTSYVGHQKIFDLDRAADTPSSDPGPES